MECGCFLQGTTRLTFKIATRGLLGLKNALLTATRGMGILNTLFDSYRPVAGAISMRENGSLVAFETGQVRVGASICIGTSGMVWGLPLAPCGDNSLLLVLVTECAHVVSSTQAIE